MISELLYMRIDAFCDGILPSSRQRAFVPIGVIVPQVHLPVHQRTCDVNLGRRIVAISPATQQVSEVGCILVILVLARVLGH